MGATVVENVKVGVIISLPFFRFKDAIASKLAEEPELTIRPNLLPKSFATFFSKSFTDGPSISVRLFLVNTSLTALISFRS